MSLTERLVLAVAIVVVDLVVFMVPLTGLAAAWIILARPPWFREWVDRLYTDGVRS